MGGIVKDAVQGRIRKMITHETTKNNDIDNPRMRLLFLGYDRKQTILIDKLIDQECEVFHTAERLTDVSFDLIVSFGFRHLLKRDLLERIECPIINLHISHLPYNRGAHPNFWSFYDGTPSGVTIHIIDGGVDTGPILYQRYVDFDQGETTFRQTHNRLLREVEDLFLVNIQEILNMEWTATKQQSEGTAHRQSDLPREFSGWDANIEEEIERLRKALKR